MSWKKFIAMNTSVFLIFLSACSFPGIPVVDNSPTLDSTIAIQTAAAGIVQSTSAAQTALANDVAATLAAMATSTPEFTFTPSITPTSSVTPTSSFTPSSTFTLTPEFPTVSVSVQTNCRSGPGSVYDLLGVMNVGQTAQVVGRNINNDGTPANDTWIIKLPSNPSITCWLWGMYAKVVGNIAGLPAVPPPPTPTPPVTFTAVYVETVSCAPQYAFTFNITNNGSITWQSIQLTITDNTTSAVFTHTLDTFRSYNGCVMEFNQLDLTPGETGPVTNVNPGQLGYNPAGHSYTAVFKLCSEDGLGGTCLEKTITFTP